jgi:hypothetical protein
MEDRELLKGRIRPMGKKDASVHLETQAEARDLKERMNGLKNNFQPEIVSMDDDMWDWLFSQCTNHIQMNIMMRALIGYETLKLDETGCVGGELRIQKREDTQAIVGMLVEMDKLVSEGADVSLLVSELEKRDHQRASISELWDIFRAYSYTYTDFIRLLDECNMRMRLVNRTIVGGKPMIALARGVRTLKEAEKGNEDETGTCYA